jgi:hypothetical protein
MTNRQIKAITQNKYVIIPNIDQTTKKLTVQVDFYFDKELSLKKDEEYVISEVDEEHFRITLLDTGQCISNGLYTEKPIIEEVPFWKEIK